MESPTSAQINKEKEKGKKLRKTQWWLNQVNDGVCHFCQGQFDRKELTMDHLVPLSRGGKSNKGNVVVCCKECNTRKKYHTPVDLILKEKMNKDITF